jgi:phage tail-like protein
MADRTERATKRLIEYLPAIYQDDSGETLFSRFLRAFEILLLDVTIEAGELGETDAVEPLERKIARLHLVFNAEQTPEEFLPWLAEWAALSFRAELSSARRRKLLSHIIPLYRIRGTRKYLEELLTLCLEATCSVSDTELPALQVGRYSTVGSDTRIGGGPPHFFRVRMVAPKLSPLEVKVQGDLAVEIIELAKPAHTYYDLEIVSPHMQVGTHSTVGLDTVLGPPPTESSAKGD